MAPRFTAGNGYFGFRVHTWNLPSGTSCPGALECLTFADRDTGRLTHGPQQTFRCYSAVGERFPAVRAAAWANFEAVRRLRSPSAIADVIDAVWPARATHVRIHAGGDFFNQAYFDAWLLVCQRHADVTCWAFTKSIPYWAARRGEIPSNLELQASLGGRHDALALALGLKTALVVDDPAAARARGLLIDHDDALAMRPGPSFALLEKAAARKVRRG